MRSNKLENAFLGAGITFMLMYIILIIAGIYATDPITGMFIALLVGVIAFPLGAILGYF
mgnify:FL=1